MKKSIIISVVLIGLACSRKTVVSTETKTPAVENRSDPSMEVPLTDERLIPNTPVKHDPTPLPADAMAAGKVLYTNRCGNCHALKPLEYYTVQQWDRILKKMMPRARLNTEEQKHVTAYVKANAKK